MLHFVSVPPISVNVCVFCANIQGSRTACRSSVMLPAVPMSIVMFLAEIFPGMYRSSLLPFSAPSALALHRFYLIACKDTFAEHIHLYRPAQPENNRTQDHTRNQIAGCQSYHKAGPLLRAAHQPDMR